MALINSKAWDIAKKNFITKMKQWQSMFWTVGFPILMLLVYKLVFTDDSGMGGDASAFDASFPGIVVFAIGMSTISSAVMFSLEKKNGTIDRLDTMPVGRANIFVGAMISEGLFMNFQIILLFVVGYGLLGAEYYSVGMLFIGYIIALLYGLGAVGLGIVIASYSDSPEAANGFGMLYLFPFMFASGSFFPFESRIVYFTPQFWVKQVYLQLTWVGDSFSDKMYGSSFLNEGAGPLTISLLVGLVVIFVFTAIFMILGIKIFQKKTNL